MIREVWYNTVFELYGSWTFRATFVHGTGIPQYCEKTKLFSCSIILKCHSILKWFMIVNGMHNLSQNQTNKCRVDFWFHVHLQRWKQTDWQVNWITVQAPWSYAPENKSWAYENWHPKPALSWNPTLTHWKYVSHFKAQREMRSDSSLSDVPGLKLDCPHCQISLIVWICQLSTGFVFFTRSAGWCGQCCQYSGIMENIWCLEASNGHASGFQSTVSVFV